MSRKLALIPARQGSVGCPGKNMADIGGKPLVGHAIDHAKAAGVFDDILVSSDWPELLKYSKDQGVLTLDRPVVLSTGTTAVTDVVIHALGAMANSGREYDSVTLLNPTSPMRRPEDIVGLHQAKAKCGAPCGVTITMIKPIPMCKRRQGSGRWWHVADLPYYSIRRKAFDNRQSRMGFYAQNGAVYIVDVPYLKETGKLVGEKCAAWVMPKERSVDIDDPWDLIAARAIYAEYQRIGAQEIDLRQPEGLNPEGRAAGSEPGAVLPAVLS